MKINGVFIEDTFAEAFGMTATRIIITAANERWARQAAVTMTGFATSVIACGVEAGIEMMLPPDQTPDGRPGVAVLMFSISGTELEKQLEKRLGQCILTCPTTAAFAGMESEKKIRLGKGLRYFGDGYQISKLIDGKRYWRIPVMDGEFLVEETTSRSSAIGGGNFLILARSQNAALAAAEAAIEVMDPLPGVIMPFPGGVVRSGSKVGSKYKALSASTNDAYCPTLTGLTESKLSTDVKAVLEIVIDGVDEESINQAMIAGIGAVCERGTDNGILAITAGNYGGKLGKFHFKLRELMA